MIVVLISCLVLLRRQPVINAQAAPRGPSATFLGFTNVPIKGKRALFTLSDHTDVTMVCAPEAVEVLTNGFWLRKPLVGKAMWQAFRDWTGFQEELKPKQSLSFVVTHPSLDYRVEVGIRLPGESRSCGRGH